MSSLTSHCEALASPNPFAVTLAGCLVLGILVSYLPQHLKIISRRSSEGLSPWWVLLGGLSSIAAVGNILTLPASREDIKCCKSLDGGSCAAALLGVAQIGVQWSCFMFIVMLFLIFFPATPTTDLAASIGSLASHEAPPRRRDALIVGSATLLALLFVGITSVAMVSAFPHHTQNWANFLGSVSGALAAVQYLPQIYYTWRLGDVKSLSVVTMLIQVPGAFLFAFSLWLRVGWEGWSTWLVYIVTGLLQAMLLVLAINYWIERKRAEKLVLDSEEEQEDAEADGDATPDAEPDERTGLLGAGNGRSAKQMIKGAGTGTTRSRGSDRQLGMLYAATPPDQDSDVSELDRRGR